MYNISNAPVETLEGSTVRVKGNIHNITYPKSGHQDGDFAIFNFRITSVMSGQLSQYALSKVVTGGIGICCKGNAPELNKKYTYDLTAKLVINSKYGPQYEIVCMDKEFSIESIEDQRKFFEYFLPYSTIEKLFEAFENPISVLAESDVASLCKISGIKEKTALKLIEKYNENIQNSMTFVKFYEYGLTRNMCQRLIKRYGSVETAISKLEENPYILINDVDGIGWSKADEIARTHGIEPDDPRRLKAYVNYNLEANANTNGHTCINVDKLVSDTKAYITCADETVIKTVIVEMIKSGDLFYEKDGRRIALSKNRKNEERIASELFRINEADKVLIPNVAEIIEECEKTVGYEYSDEQKAAINACVENNITIITALAGSGKSSMMYPVVEAMRRSGYNVEQCCLSGKAALNLTEITKIRGKTIHKLLGWTPDGFTYGIANKLPADMIIVDEVSMVPEDIFLDLLKATASGTKLVLIGDSGQLEPIGVGAVLKDMTLSGCINHIHLTKIFRQAAKSGIITDSIKVYNQKGIFEKSPDKEETHGELQDMHIVSVGEAEEATIRAVKEYKKLYDSGESIDDIVVVVGKRSIGITSAREINRRIQEIVIPKEYGGRSVCIPKKDGETSYKLEIHVGDRILITKNMYDTTDTRGEVSPVFNGNIGSVKDLTQAYIIAEFPQGEVCIQKEMWQGVELGYAISCHKSQGSGFKHVIVICTTDMYMLLSKEWLYTAITRAKKHCTLVCQKRAVQKAIETTRVKEKQTFLRELIIQKFTDIEV